MLAHLAPVEDSPYSLSDLPLVEGRLRPPPRLPDNAGKFLLCRGKEILPFPLSLTAEKTDEAGDKPFAG
jgi:hypothetical protein